MKPADSTRHSGNRDGIAVVGCGAVSPAGWGIGSLREAAQKNTALPIKELSRPGVARPLRVRAVPPALPRPAYLAHPRLRRSSPITQFAVGAALEALGEAVPAVRDGRLRLGIIFCVMAGSVVYSRRFYDEVWRDPATASPLIFPETVFNAPASHLAALLETSAINYTLVGDAGMFLQGVAAAGHWLLQGKVDGCLVIGAEECDWIVSNAFQPFHHSLVLAEGAGALYLRRGANASAPCLSAVTNACSYSQSRAAAMAAAHVRAELPPGRPDELLCDGIQNLPRLDAPELAAWRNWPGTRISVKTVLGEGLMAGAAWQCVMACDALRQGRFAAAQVSVIGANQQAIGARFARSAAPAL